MAQLVAPWARSPGRANLWLPQAVTDRTHASLRFRPNSQLGQEAVETPFTGPAFFFGLHNLSSCGSQNHGPSSQTRAIAVNMKRLHDCVKTRAVLKKNTSTSVIRVLIAQRLCKSQMTWPSMCTKSNKQHSAAFRIGCQLSLWMALIQESIYETTLMSKTILSESFIT